jgi:hypothetical protein
MLNLRSKAQYELHFKKWEFRKNLTKDDWKIVGPKIGRRKREHKESEVYNHGNLIQSKKIRKAISRYGFMSGTTEMQLQGNHIRINFHLMSSLRRQRHRRERQKALSSAHRHPPTPPLHRSAPHQHQCAAQLHQRTQSLF